MKKIFLQKITQYNTESYIGKIDPRELVRIAEEIEMGEVQDAQRPLNPQRVKSISTYVGEKGILPNTLTIATKDKRMAIKYDDELKLYYIDFPETNAEYDSYKDSIFVMDGQHRLYSFKQERCLLTDETIYEIGFTLYETPSLDEKRKIFISCNEKQEKVSGNLLMWFREKLNMLSEDEKKYYYIVTKLNNSYPLSGHIIMSAEKIKNGVKANEIMKAMDKAKIDSITNKGNKLDDDTMTKLICSYLSAWEDVVGFSFTNSSQKEAGAAIKMSGLKYMLMLLPDFCNKAITEGKIANKAFFENNIARLISAFGVTKEEFFICEEHKLYFREKSNTEFFAEQSKAKIIQMDAGDVDIFTAYYS